MLKNADNEAGNCSLLKKSEDRPSASSLPVKKSMAVKVSNQAKRFFTSLYQYTIISCMSSLQLTNYWLSDEPPEELSNEPDTKRVVIEMNSFPPGNQNASVQDGAPKSKKAATEKESQDERMKKKIKFHFQSHLQKWKRQRFPVKVTLHLLLIVLVTTQVSS